MVGVEGFVPVGCSGFCVPPPVLAFEDKQESVQAIAQDVHVAYAGEEVKRAPAATPVRPRVFIADFSFSSFMVSPIKEI